LGVKVYLHKHLSFTFCPIFHKSHKVFSTLSQTALVSGGFGQLQADAGVLSPFKVDVVGRSGVWDAFFF
jgi:hypothetical protein